LRVVLDTNTVLSALLFPAGHLAWLRELWEGHRIVPLASRAAVDELIRVLAYPKFKLQEEEIGVLAGSYLQYVEVVEVDALTMKGLPRCREEADQIFLQLAAAGKADVLVTGDRALLELAGRTTFAIETAVQFKERFLPERLG
jgi:putative PIN family toxin of toxin-antitoxin system